MRIDCIPYISETQSQQLAGKTVFVIDVLRATSVMTTALVNGASGVVPVETVAQAKAAAREGDLLSGERHCEKIPGFHLGNSPFEYARETVSGKRIVMTTTNGTRGIQKASSAAAVFAGSMVNAAACAAVALKLKRDVVLLCAGTRDVFALEDGLCAGLIAHEMHRAAARPLEISDFASAMRAAYMQQEARLAETMLACDSGRRLTKLGFREDVLLCASVNRYDLVPVLSAGELKPF